MRSGLEVGKKYKYCNNNSYIYECLFVGKHMAFLRNTNSGTEFTTSHSNQYEEVIEPRREFFNVHKDNSDTTYYRGAFSSRDIADRVSYGGRYGVLELIHHSETKVESVFHMVDTKTIPTKSY